ncbi:hypothetical protein M752DRAFT_17209 [Aspergillus phoenicis ATCC 13157]|uniref:Uncharacterized protein n=1 Tax=Aspergillus phoenicis ATCC 13157 TaxID=1353007 RepID=A0A370PK05_ASPPH|nr:hypothetical protein M752DRAFT_17209 [Aspergillus phoenicis ATCC 13157]
MGGESNAPATDRTVREEGRKEGGKEKEREREREGKKEEDHKQSGTCGRVMVRPRAIKPLSDRGTGTSGRLGRGGSPQWCSTGCDSSIHLINPWGYNQEIPANVVGTRPLGVCTGSWVLDCRINIDNGCLILLFFSIFLFFLHSLSPTLFLCVCLTLGAYECHSDGGGWLLLRVNKSASQ